MFPLNFFIGTQWDTDRGRSKLSNVNLHHYTLSGF